MAVAKPTTAVLDRELSRVGYRIVRRAVPHVLLDDVLRLLHLDWLERGLDAEELGHWLQAYCWFPHLRWSEPILKLAASIPERYRAGEMAEPQIVLQFPDSAGRDIRLVPHLDESPPWANGRSYTAIVGVPLSRNHPQNGSLRVWPFTEDDHRELTLEPGDLIVMDPRLPHSAGVNLSGEIRYAVYFRFLAT